MELVMRLVERFRPTPADEEPCVRRGEHLTCSAGHRCAVFLDDLHTGDLIKASSMKSVQKNFRVREGRVIPPCFECGRVTWYASSMHVENRWVPPLDPEDLKTLNAIEGNA